MRPQAPDDRPLARLDHPHREIWLSARTKGERRRARACRKEPWTVDWIESAVAPGDVFYDVGANAGAYALVAAQACRGDGAVVALEPAAGTFALLVDNVRINGLDDVITALPVALSAETGLTELHYTSLDVGAAFHITGDRRPLYGREVVRTERVLSFRLDDLVNRLDLPAPNHIKIDVDGTEDQVLAGAEQALRSPTLRSLMIEIEDGTGARVLELTEAAGLRLAQRNRPQKRGTDVAHSYGLFAR
jgi:FkbM family methyltransferase